MPVPSLITDLSTTAASNSPAGSDNTFPDLDNFLRAHAAFIAQNYANKAPKAAPAFTGQAEFAGGTTAAPSITFTGDLNTGFYSPAADAIAATTGAAARLYIGSDGRVSISPAAVAAAANTHMLVDRLSGSSLPALTAGTVLTLAGSTAAGSPAYLQLISGNASTAEVRFGDTDAALRGSVGYDNATDVMSLMASGSTSMTVSSSQVAMASGVELVLSDALSTSEFDAGYKGSPVVDRNATSSFGSTDSGKTIRKTNTTAYTWTIQPDSTTNYPIGSWIEVLHDSTAGDVTIARGAGVVLMSGTSDTNVTVTAGNSGRVQKVAANRWRYIAY